VFRKKFEAVIKNAQIKDYLISRRKRIVVKHNLNIKLLLNIVGYLANEGKNINKNYVEYRVGAKLEKEIAYFWNIKRGTRSYHKYVSGYETGDSDLSQKIIKILQSSFN
jgi:predicted transcriptional regulator